MTVVVALVLPFASGAGASSVRVAQGQTLTQIARQYGTTVAAITAANDLANPDHILAGSLLQIPSSVTTSATTPAASSGSVVVTAGESLSYLAAHYGTTVASLVALNGIANPDHIEIGSTLRLPSSGANATAPVVFVTPASPSLPAVLLANPDRLALRPVFVRWATQEGVSPALLEAMCWWESGWQASVTSVTGAVGACQLEPATTDQERTALGVPGLNPTVASDNIEMAAGYLASLLRETGDDPTLALAGYYQGLASVSNAGFFLSTQQYVHGILAYVPAFS